MSKMFQVGIDSNIPNLIKPPVESHDHATFYRNIFIYLKNNIY